MSLNCESKVNEEGTRKKFVLPLHQRLALIQMDRKLASKKEAFKVLVEKGEWNTDNNDETREDDVSSNNEVNVGIVPLTGGVKHIDLKRNRAVLVDKIKGLREFKFDNILSDQCSQQSCYESGTMSLIGEFLNGISGTSIVYGQTGR